MHETLKWSANIVVRSTRWWPLTYLHVGERQKLYELPFRVSARASPLDLCGNPEQRLKRARASSARTLATAEYSTTVAQHQPQPLDSALAGRPTIRRNFCRGWNVALRRVAQ